MTRSRAILVAWSMFTLTAVTGTIRADDPKWKPHTINGRSEFEAAGVFDVDNDGQLDIVSGDSWYQGPGWKPYHVRDVERVGTYYHCFATLPLDVNGDGNTDYLTCSYFGKSVGWVENPGAVGKPWTYHEVDQPGNIEAAWMVDLSGDGVPDLLPNTVNVVVWYEVVKKGDGGKGYELKKHDLGASAAGHGVGSGDVNGDGRVDLLTPKGWYEAPSDASHDSWTWHPDWQIGATGIQILARDVDGDGLSDVVYGMGHDYGLLWLHQGKGTGGERTWTKHAIDKSIASVHTLLWADLDGDGKDNELVTGKRVYAARDRAGRDRRLRDCLVSVRPEFQGMGQARDFPGRAGQERPGEGRRAPRTQGLPARDRGHRPPDHRHRYRQGRRSRSRLPRQERTLSLREPADREALKRRVARELHCPTPPPVPMPSPFPGRRVRA